MSFSGEPKGDADYDVEKDITSVSERNPDDFTYTHPLLQKVRSWGVETRGALVVPTTPNGPLTCVLSKAYGPYLPSCVQTSIIARFFTSGYLRTSTSYRTSKIVPEDLWIPLRLRSFSAGTLGPVVYGLSLRDTCLCILFFNLLCAIMPAYLCVSLTK